MLLREGFGLFVDDGSVAVSILCWLGVVGFLLPHTGWLPRWQGVILFAGLGLILLETALRGSRTERS
jgi:hypothetical protein